MTNYERWRFKEIGRNKNIIYNLVVDGGLNWPDGRACIRYHLDEIDRHVKLLKEEAEKKDPIENWNDYTREWDLDIANGVQPEDSEFRKIGTPKPEWIDHQKEKQRHEKRRARKYKK